MDFKVTAAGLEPARDLLTMPEGYEPSLWTNFRYAAM